jgi:hypothetical protein
MFLKFHNFQPQGKAQQALLAGCTAGLLPSSLHQHFCNLSKCTWQRRLLLLLLLLPPLQAQHGCCSAFLQSLEPASTSTRQQQAGMA